MAKKSSGASELAKAKAEWQKLYQEPDLKKRIDGAIKISKDANRLVEKHGEEKVKAALKEVVNDRTVARRLLRLSGAFNSTQLNKAKKNIGTGASRSHLLLLTQVDDEQERLKLFEDSITHCWSVQILRENIRGKSNVNATARPTQLSKTIRHSMKSLINDLRRFSALNVEESIAQVKASDLEKLKRNLEVIISQSDALQKDLKIGRKACKCALQAVKSRLK